MSLSASRLHLAICSAFTIDPSSACGQAWLDIASAIISEITVNADVHPGTLTAADPGGTAPSTHTISGIGTVQ